VTVAFKIHAGDNVATLLADAAPGCRIELRGEAGGVLPVNERVALGHKVAIAAIETGAQVVKFGIPIGSATAPIAPGDWVHLHNCASGFDERSGGFDVVTGAGKDVAYD